METIMRLVRDNVINLLEKYPEGLPPVAIMPFGKNGIIAKQVLNLQFGIQESYIVDNKLSKYNKAILGVKELSEVKGRLVVLITATSEVLSYNLKRQLASELGSDAEIVSIIEPIVKQVDGRGEYFGKVRDLLSIKKPEKYSYVRIGRDNDGGYIMADDFDAGMKAYSFGISDDMSWDIDVRKKGVSTVYMYDHTIEDKPSAYEGCVFHKTGIGFEDDPAAELLSMRTIMENNGDIDNNNLILKMDIEGAEWSILDSFDEEFLDRFKQMAFEFHGMTDPAQQDIILSVLNKLNCTHQAGWIHGNNYSPAEMSEGVLLPDALEVLFLNRRAYSFSDERVTLPFEYDMPNFRSRKDFILE